MGDTSMNWFCSKTLIFMLILLSGLGMLYHQCPLFYYLASVIQNSNSRSGFYSYPAYIDMMFETQVILNNDLQIKFMFHSGWPTFGKNYSPWMLKYPRKCTLVNLLLFLQNFQVCQKYPHYKPMYTVFPLYAPDIDDLYLSLRYCTFKQLAGPRAFVSYQHMYIIPLSINLYVFIFIFFIFICIPCW